MKRTLISKVAIGLAVTVIAVVAFVVATRPAPAQGRQTPTERMNVEQAVDFPNDI
jgi:hypothetical protein